MNIKNSFDITVSETLIQRLQETKETAKQSLNYLTDKAQQVSDDWQQTATQNTENAVDIFNNTIEKTKDSLAEHLPQVSVETAVNSSIKNWFEQHPAFLGIIKSLNWAANHPIISLIIFIVGLAILWTVIKAIGRLIEKASLSVLQIPLKLLGSLTKYCWRSLSRFSVFAAKKFTSKKAIIEKPELQLEQHTAFEIISSNKQQRLKDISTRLEEIQVEQQELLKEAADILDVEKISTITSLH